MSRFSPRFNYMFLFQRFYIYGQNTASHICSAEVNSP